MTTGSIRVMIADDNKEFCVLVQEYIEEQDDMELVGVAYNGMEVLEKIDTAAPVNGHDKMDINGHEN